MSCDAGRRADWRSFWAPRRNAECRGCGRTERRLKRRPDCGGTIFRSGLRPGSAFRLAWLFSSFYRSKFLFAAGVAFANFGRIVSAIKVVDVIVPVTI